MLKIQLILGHNIVQTNLLIFYTRKICSNNLRNYIVKIIHVSRSKNLQFQNFMITVLHACVFT